MTEHVYVACLVHEVTTVHFISVRDHAPEVKLNMRCGGYITVPREFDWHCADVVTCFWCIAHASRDRIDRIQLTGVVTGRMSSMHPNTSVKPRRGP